MQHEQTEEIDSVRDSLRCNYLYRLLGGPHLDYVDGFTESKVCCVVVHTGAGKRGHTIAAVCRCHQQTQYCRLKWWIVVKPCMWLHIHREYTYT